MEREKKSVVGPPPSEDQLKVYSQYRDEMKEELRKNGSIYFMDKSTTGYVGLLNQGATCYLNSLLQTLFFTPEFKDAIYAWSYNPESHGSEEYCIPFQLQRLFAQLDLSERAAVSTKPLTHAFGWTAADAFHQHDVQELFAKLLEALELAAPAKHRDLDRLFSGKVADRLRCGACGGGRRREAPFRDLQLDLPPPPPPGSSPAAAAALGGMLAAFSAKEVLDGDNRWFCEACGEKVAAEKWLEVTEFPEVLCLHLKRFVFDMITMRRSKISQPVSLPAQIDAAKYRASKEQQDVEMSCSDEEEEVDLYDLSAVLMHSGTAHGGHYRVFVRNLLTGRWYEFNDAVVTELEGAALEQLITAAAAPAQAKGSGAAPAAAPALADGGDDDHSSGRSPPPRDPTSDAYMLVYRRAASPEASVKMFGEPDPPPEVHRAAVEEENTRFRRLRAAHAVARSMVALRVFHPLPVSEDVAQECGAGGAGGAGGGGAGGGGRSLWHGGGECTLFLHDLHVHESTTLDQVMDMLLEHLEKVGGKLWEIVGGGEGVPRARRRLRRWAPAARRGGETFGGRGGAAVGALGLGPGADLALETRGGGEEFVEFDPHAMTLDLILWVSPPAAAADGEGESAPCLGGPGGGREHRRTVLVPGEKQATVGALRCAAAFAFAGGGAAAAAERVLLVRPPAGGGGGGGGAGALLAEDGARLAGQCRVWPGEQIVVELVPEESEVASYTSKAMEAYLREQENISISFNQLASTEYDTSVELKLSSTVSELKDLIGSELSLNSSSIHLKRNATAPQIKDESKTLRSLGFVNLSVVHVGEGPPLRPGEHLVQFVLYEPSAKPQFAPLLELPVAGSMKVAELKETVFNKLPKDLLDKHSRDLNASHIRLRDKKGKDPGGILKDQRSISKSLMGLTDGRQIALQILEDPEIMGNDDIVIQVRQWQVTEKKMAPPKEILISKQATTDSMMHVLSTKFANLLLSDSDGLMFAKGTSFGPPLTAKSAHKLKWQEVSLSQADEGGGSTNPAAAAAVVARPPLSLRDGSILVLRSRQDYARAKEIAQEAKQAAGPKSAQKAAGAGRRRVTPFRPVERELRIHVATAGAGASPGGGELRIGGRDTAAGTAGEELLPPGSPPDAVVAAPPVAPPTELQFEQ